MDRLDSDGCIRQAAALLNVGSRRQVADSSPENTVVWGIAARQHSHVRPAPASSRDPMTWKVESDTERDRGLCSVEVPLVVKKRKG